MEKPMQKKMITLISGTLFLLMTGNVFAQDQAPAPSDEEIRKLGTKALASCENDINKYCSKVPAGEGRIAECLYEQKSKLSSKCKSDVEELSLALQTRIEQATQRFMAACGDDAKKYCGRVPAGGGRVISCLMGREGDLQESCEQFIDKVNQRIDEAMY